jgi:hypothetical protein
MHAYQNTAGGNAPSKPKVNAPNLTLRRKYIDEAGLKKVVVSSTERYCLATSIISTDLLSF